ncbi:Contactin-associated protein-like 5 [Exaiptasia diaphana]|nr:Contactin-associated protein-like 5 [Exaiptasia diaphana]
MGKIEGRLGRKDGMRKGKKDGSREGGRMISKVAIQGRGMNEQYVTKISLKYSADGSQWFDYKDTKYTKEFQGNVDQSSIVTHKLPLSIKTRYIRVVVLAWNNGVAMRLEFYGCQPFH